MFVRMKIGGHAGEIKEVSYEIGRGLLENERAEKVSFDPDNPAPPPSIEKEVAVNVAPIQIKKAPAKPIAKAAAKRGSK